jgi:hypothetical protein
MRTAEIPQVSTVRGLRVWVTGGPTGIDHWDYGSAWTIVPSPSPGAIYNTLNSVSALSASDVWAVGQSGQQKFNTERFLVVLHWDGRKWSRVTV